ncbi:CD63 antigen-like [Aphidius gifuensis]|uniref:CD63 antigen-like n=1 Tax=Aphidius gifuensis TaxID=684658 RepID=UPI001CDBD2D9|nr:CD63 antigen-like [Aphidius gifuensis]
MELSASIWIWTNKDNMIDIGEIMSQYEENQEARLTLDAMQTSLQCCGSTGPSDWVKYRNHVINDISAPHSCCFSTKNNENNTITCSGYYQKGCSGPLKTFIHENAIKIITSAIIIVSIQVKY